MTELTIGSMTIPDCETHIRRGYYDWARAYTADEAVPAWDEAGEARRQSVAMLGYRFYDGAGVPAGNDLGATEAYLTQAVFSNVSHQDVVRLLLRTEQARPLLARIPEDARLETGTEDQIEAAGALIDLLSGARYIKLAKATKLLYKKRPGFIPVIDEFVGTVLARSYPLKRRSTHAELLRLYREILQERETPLSHIQAELDRHGLRLSRARIVSYAVWLSEKQARGAAAQAQKTEG